MQLRFFLFVSLLVVVCLGKPHTRSATQAAAAGSAVPPTAAFHAPASPGRPHSRTLVVVAHHKPAPLPAAKLHRHVVPPPVVALAMMPTTPLFLDGLFDFLFPTHNNHTADPPHRRSFAETMAPMRVVPAPY